MPPRSLDPQCGTHDKPSSSSWSLVNRVIVLFIHLAILAALTSMNAFAQTAPAARDNAVVLALGLQGQRVLNDVTISGDGTVALVATLGQIAVLDARTGLVVHNVAADPSWVYAVSFDPKGRWAVSAGTAGVKIWRLPDLTLVTELARGRFYVVNVSVDGDFVAAGDGDGRVMAWQSGSWSLRHDDRIGGPIGAVAISSETNSIAAAQGYKDDSGSWTSKPAHVALWRIGERGPAWMIPAHQNDITDLEFADRGRKLISASGSHNPVTIAGPTMSVWDVRQGNRLTDFDAFARRIVALTSLPDGRVYALAPDNNTTDLLEVIWPNLSLGIACEGISDRLDRLAVSASGNAIGIARWSDGVSLWTHISDCRKSKRVTAAEAADASQTIYLPRLATFVHATGSQIVGLDLVSGAKKFTASLTGRRVAKLRAARDTTAFAVLLTDGIAVLSGETGAQINEFRLPQAANSYVHDFEFVDDDRVVVATTDSSTPKSGEIQLWNWRDQRLLARNAVHEQHVSRMLPVDNGSNLLSASWDGTIKLSDMTTLKPFRTFIKTDEQITDLSVSPDGRSFVAVWTYEEDGSGTVGRWELGNSDPKWIAGRYEGFNVVDHLPDGNVLIGGQNILLLDSSTGTTAREYRGLPTGETVASLFRPHDGSSFAAVTGAGNLRFWKLAESDSLAGARATSDGWLTFAGPRFDASLSGRTEALGWAVGDEPFRSLPLETFMRDYFEPRLLPRLLACRDAEQTRPDACTKEFKQVRPLASLNRALPEVRVVSVTAAPAAADEVSVTLEVRGVEARFGTKGQERTWQSGAFDLRLFRDGQLVGQAPDLREPEPLEASDIEADVGRWREAHRLVEGVGRKEVTFRNIRLPKREPGDSIEFSAYAFNVDRVKSVTASTPYAVPQRMPVRDRRAYVVAVGVSAYEDPAWDLKYADDDARRLVEVLEPRLRSTGQYKEVVSVPLLADWTERDGARTVTTVTATKANVKAALDILAGRDVPEKMRRALPNGMKLERARPDDLVLIGYSSHGYADKAGNFYLFPYDIGSNTGRAVSTEILKRAISSAELSAWLRDVDAGELIMVVDACHSAASVESAEFKPGPMGARGLGQLAYDKGMRILASTRADDVAWESARTRQGLLSYALVHDGVEEGKADFRPADGRIGIQEWLEYAALRVPQLYAEAMNFRGGPPNASPPSTGATPPARLLAFDSHTRTPRYITRSNTPPQTQQPTLFNYKRGEDPILVLR
jgi:WD40 repeat protein